MAIKKIVKKHDKVTGEKMASTWMAEVQQRVFFTHQVLFFFFFFLFFFLFPFSPLFFHSLPPFSPSFFIKDLDRLKRVVEVFYAKYFCDGNKYNATNRLKQRLHQVRGMKKRW